jgi:hypothetical protein
VAASSLVATQISSLCSFTQFIILENVYIASRSNKFCFLIQNFSGCKKTWFCKADLRHLRKDNSTYVILPLRTQHVEYPRKEVAHSYKKGDPFQKE